MPTYLHPGVYVEEIPSGSKPIEAASTSVAAFVGQAHRGPVGEPTLIHSLGDYVREFGPIGSEEDWMGLAIQAFYLNGGKDAYICRLANPGGATAKASDTVDGQGTAAGTAVITVQATSAGAWGNRVSYQIVKPDQDSMAFDLLVGHVENDEFLLDEAFPGLTMNDEEPTYILKSVNGESALVEIALEPAADPEDTVNGQYHAGTVTGGTLPNDEENAGQPGKEHHLRADEKHHPQHRTGNDCACSFCGGRRPDWPEPEKAFFAPAPGDGAAVASAGLTPRGRNTPGRSGVGELWAGRPRGRNRWYPFPPDGQARLLPGTRGFFADRPLAIETPAEAVLPISGLCGRLAESCGGKPIARRQNNQPGPNLDPIPFFPPPRPRCGAGAGRRAAARD